MSAISFNDSLPLLSSAESSGYQKDDSSDSKRIKRVAEQSMNLTESSSQHSVKLGDINSEIQPGQHSIASFATSLLPYSTESTEEENSPSTYEIQQQQELVEIEQQFIRRRELLRKSPNFKVNFNNLQSTFLINSVFGAIFRNKEHEKNTEEKAGINPKKRKLDGLFFDLKEDCVQNLTFHDDDLLDIYETLRDIGQNLFAFLNNNKEELDLEIVNLLKTCNSEGVFYVQSLFYLIGLFSLQEFQREYLEPFNSTFKNFPIDDIPTQVIALDIDEKDIDSRTDFSDLENLEELRLNNAKELSANQFNSFPLKTIKKLFIEKGNLLGFNFSALKYLTELELKDVNDLSVDLFNSIPKNFLKKLTIEYTDCNKKNQADFDFLQLEGIEDLEIIQSETLTTSQFDSLPKTCLKRLKLKGDVRHLNFSTLIDLEELTVDCYRMDVGQVNSLPKQRLKKLCLDGNVRISQVDFSDFNALEEIRVFSNEDISTFESYPIKADQFNNFPNPGILKKMSLRDLDLQGFNFSNLEQIEDLDFKYVKNFTSEQFNALPKNQLKKLDLSSVLLPSYLEEEEEDILINVTGFDFPSLLKIEELDLGAVKGLTAVQFNALPKEYLKKLNLSEIDVTDFDFSRLENIENLNLFKAKGLTAEQFNALPKEHLKKLNLSGTLPFNLGGGASVDVTDFNFSSLKKIEDINLSETSGLTAQQFNTLPKDYLKTLHLDLICLTGFDFSDLVNIESLSVNNNTTFTQSNMLELPSPERLKSISLYNNNVSDFNFSSFISLRNIELNRAKGLTPEVFNTVPRRYLTNFSFNTIKSPEGFDFSGLRHVKGGIFMFLRHITD
jgi:hypothetical protein